MGGEGFRKGCRRHDNPHPRRSRTDSKHPLVPPAASSRSGIFARACETPGGKGGSEPVRYLQIQRGEVLHGRNGTDGVYSGGCRQVCLSSFWPAERNSSAVRKLLRGEHGRLGSKGGERL